MNRKRSHNEIKSDAKTHLAGLADLPPDRDALEKFKRQAYQTPAVRTIPDADGRLRTRMTFAELTEAMYRLIGSQAYMMSDPVPDWLIRTIRGDNEDMAEYLARKYKIGGTDGGYK